MKFQDYFMYEEDGLGREFRPDIAASLVRFLNNFGPMSYHPALPMVVTSAEADSAINLLLLDEELSSLGEAAQLVFGNLSTPSVRGRLNQLLREGGDAAWREVAVLPVFAKSTEEAYLTAKPRTLRSVLWLDIFRSAERTRRLCRYCQKGIERRVGPGRPYEFCAVHRTHRYRKRAERDLAGTLSVSTRTPR